MCFQGFVYYICGHNKIVEHECDLAVDQPLYLKIACPDYRTARTHLKQQCGIGKYYCRHKQTGQVLETVYEDHIRSQTDISNIDIRMAKLQGLHDAFNHSADLAGVSLEARGRHPAYSTLANTQTDLMKLRDERANLRVQSLQKIQQAIEYFSKLEQKQLGFANPLPEFLYYGMIANSKANCPVSPPEAQTQAFGGTLHTTAPGHQQLGLAGPSQQDVVREAGNTTHGPPGPNAFTAHLAEQARRTLSGQQGGFDNQHGQSKTPAIYDNKLGRQKPTVERGSPGAVSRRKPSPKKARSAKEDSDVRRSARVKDKKVSYAESEGSEGFSRDPSPEKSDISGFSPSKSELSASPAKSDIVVKRRIREPRSEANELDDKKLTRGVGSLSNLIGDWQRRSGVASHGPTGGVKTDARGKIVLYETPAALQPRCDIPKGTTALGAPFGHPTLAEYMRRGGETAKPAVVEAAYAGRGVDLPAWYGPSGGNSHFGRNANTAQEVRPPTRHGPPSRDPTGMLGSNVPQAAAMPNFLPTQNMQSNLFNAYANSMHGAETANRPMVHPENLCNAETTQPIVDRNWLINTPAFTSQASVAPFKPTEHHLEAHGSGSLPGERSDSVIGVAAIAVPHSNSDEPPNDLKYDQMRRSFSAAADLTPPTVIDLTATDTEPKKRKVLASSPLPLSSSNKRMRLSLPGDDTTLEDNRTNVSYGKRGSMSSPSKIPTQPETGSSHYSLPFTSKNAPATPAPILAPTAVMHIPSHKDRDGEDQANVEPSSVDLPDQDVLRDDGTDDIPNLFSDIDWSMIDEDHVI